MQPTLEQPKTGIGSTAETNRLLGGSYFDEQTGGQIKQFTPTAPSTTFNAEALAQGTKSITIPPTPYSTTAAGITGGSQAVIDNQKINEKLIADEAAKTAKLTEQKVVLDKSKEAIMGKQTEKIAAEGDVNTPGTPAWQKEQARQLSLRLDKSQRGQINELTALETQSMSPAGKQQAESAINRRYALEQGDLQLKYHIAASDYNAAAETLNKKFELELEPLKTDYDDQVNLYNQYKDDLTKTEDRQWTKIISDSDNAVKTKEANQKEVSGLFAKLNENNPQVLKNNPALVVKLANAENGVEFNQLLATNGIGLGKPTSGTGSNTSTDNERALMTQFRGEQIVKDYNDILGQKGTIDAYIQNGVGGPADLALVFSFMKGLDPTSVVRESEYETAAKSGNIFQGVFAKFNGYFKAKGGFLPANVRQEFQNLVNQKLAVKQKQYDNVKSQYESIANRQQLNPQNVVIDYASGGGSVTPASVAPKEEPIYGGLFEGKDYRSNYGY